MSVDFPSIRRLSVSLGSRLSFNIEGLLRPDVVEKLVATKVVMMMRGM
jgi:hypothetical protein